MKVYSKFLIIKQMLWDCKSLRVANMRNYHSFIDGMEMHVVHDSLIMVSRHLSAHKAVIQLLFTYNHTFRETCIDYRECSRALIYWSRLGSHEALIRKKEYTNLLGELEEEILQALEN